MSSVLKDLKNQNKIPNQQIIYQDKYFNIKECDDYLYGFCHLFALCARDVFKDRAEIKAVWQHLDSNMSDYGFLAHAYVVIDGKHWIDCRGHINQAVILNEYIIDFPTSYLIENAEKEILFHMEEEMFDPFEPEEKNQIIKFIEKNISLYEN